MVDIFPATFDSVSTTDDAMAYFFENDLPFSPQLGSAADQPLHSLLSPVPDFPLLDDPLDAEALDDCPPPVFAAKLESQPAQFTAASFAPPPQFFCASPPSAAQSPQSPPQAQLASPYFESATSTAHSLGFVTQAALDSLRPTNTTSRTASDDNDSHDDDEPTLRTPAKRERGEGGKATAMSPDALSELGTGVTLPRHVLIKITSEEFEAYAAHLMKLRELSADEQKELRRQRRMVKNREYAQENRSKKKKASMTTHQQFAELEKENQLLRSENSMLKQEVVRLRTMLSEVAYHQATVKPGSIVSSTPTTSAWDYLSVGSLRTNASVKATAACLFVVLFSFALFHAAPDANMASLPTASSRVLLGISQWSADAAGGVSSWLCRLPLVSQTSWCSAAPAPDPPRATTAFAFDESAACK